jgi:hypothetical protein
VRKNTKLISNNKRSQTIIREVEEQHKKNQTIHMEAESKNIPKLGGAK